MEIIISKSSENYFKNKFNKKGIPYDKDLVLDSLNSLLLQYKNSLPNDLKIYIYKNDELAGKNICHDKLLFIKPKNAIALSSRYVLEYMTSDNCQFSGECILECIGHELGHNNVIFYNPFLNFTKNLFFTRTRFFSKDKFIARLIEVYCDHHSLTFTGFNVETHEKIMEEHAKRKKKSDNLWHPTWEKRKEYIKRAFDESLIRDIAKDNYFYDESIIVSQIEYYNTVNEKGRYIIKKAIYLSYLNYIITFVIGMSFVLANAYYLSILLSCIINYILILIK